MKLLLTMLLMAFILSCKSPYHVQGKPGIIKEDKKGRWVWGNAKAFQDRLNHKNKENEKANN